MAGVGVELACGLGQGQVGDLVKILVRDAAAAVAGGDRVGDPHVELDHLGEEASAGALRAMGRARQEVGSAGGALGALRALGRGAGLGPSVLWLVQ